MSIDQLINKVRAYREEHSLKKATLAQLAGLHQNSLRMMDSPDWNPTVETLRLLEEVIAEPPAAEAAG